MGIRPDFQATRRFRTAGWMSSPSAEPARRGSARISRASRVALALAVALSLCLAPIVAVAQSANTGAGGDPRTSVAQPEVSSKPSAVATTSIQSVLDDAADPTGLRRFLSDRCVVLSFNAIADILGDTSGGTRRTATVLGRLDMQLDADLDRLAGKHGAAFDADCDQVLLDVLPDANTGVEALEDLSIPVY